MPPQWTVSRCEADECRAEIIWARSETGRKRMPVNAEPELGGNIRLTDGVPGLEPFAIVVPAKNAFARKDLHKSHFATCPRSQSFRRPRKRAHAHLRKKP